MITHESAITILTLCIIGLFGCGLFVLTWGKIITGRGNWLIWSGLLALITAVGLDSGIFLKEDFHIKTWVVGWIWPRLDQGALSVGVLQDSLGLAMATLAALVAAAFLMSNGAEYQESKPERTFAAIGLSTAGVALAWNSITPWLCLGGLALSIFGGFVALGSRWDSNDEANLAARFLRERSLGFLFAFIGACILASSRPTLLLGSGEIWFSQADQVESTWVGVCLLVAGLFIQLQPFPLISWVVSSSEVHPPIRVLLCQVFPAWCAFALLTRLEPQFVKLGVFPGLGWFALASAVLSLLSGLLQKNWKLGVGSWVASGFSLSAALLAFSGGFSGLSMMIGVSLGALCLAGVGAFLEKECVQSVSNKKRAVWIKVALFFGGAGGTGVLGFVASGGGLRWIAQAINDPGMVSFFSFVLFIFVLLAWKLVWNIQSLGTASQAPWVSILALFLWSLFSLGIFWTGTVTGEVVVGSPDRLMGSLFAEFFGVKAVEFPNPNDFATASGLYWGALVLAFVAAYWTSAGKTDRWKALGEFMPKTSHFVARGYGIDFLGARTIQGFVWVGRFVEKWVDQQVWSKWIPKTLSIAVRSVSQAVSNFDQRLSSGLGGALRTSVEIPAKILQLIQTGDLRWYLFFALSSGFALLSHFLKI